MQLNFRQTESRINTLKEVLIHARKEQRFTIYYEAAVDRAPIRHPLLRVFIAGYDAGRVTR